MMTYEEVINVLDGMLKDLEKEGKGSDLIYSISEYLKDYDAAWKYGYDVGYNDAKNDQQGGGFVLPAPAVPVNDLAQLAQIGAQVVAGNI